MEHGAGRLIGRPRHARIQVLPSLPEAPSHSHQPVSSEFATIPPVPPPIPPPAPPPPSAPPEPVPTASMTVEDEQSRVQEWRRHAKRQAEVPLEDLDPAMILSDETPGGLGRAVGALEVIEELEPPIRKKMMSVILLQVETLSEKRADIVVVWWS